MDPRPHTHTSHSPSPPSSMKLLQGFWEIVQVHFSSRSICIVDSNVQQHVMKREILSRSCTTVVWWFAGLLVCSDFSENEQTWWNPDLKLKIDWFYQKNPLNCKKQKFSCECHLWESHDKLRPVWTSGQLKVQSNPTWTSLDVMATKSKQSTIYLDKGLRGLEGT